MKNAIMIIEILIGLAFLIAGYNFYDNINSLGDTIGMGKFEYMANQLIVVLCVGFGFLMIKRG